MTFPTYNTTMFANRSVSASDFGFTEIVNNSLPYSITGYAEATFGGIYPYVPPPGYRIESCEPAPVSSHGGCRGCAMCKVTCVPGSPTPEPPAPTPEPPEPIIPPEPTPEPLPPIPLPPVPGVGPIANFRAIIPDTPLPVRVTFINESTGNPTTWSWNFGDGTTSTEQHPTHAYTSPGTYLVTLTVSNSFGGNTTTAQIVIKPKSEPTPTPEPSVPEVEPTAKFRAVIPDTPLPVKVTFINESTGNPTTWLWNFGDGTTSTEQHPTHTYTNPGTYIVTLTVSNNFGENTTTAPIVIELRSEPTPTEEPSGLSDLLESNTTLIALALVGVGVVAYLASKSKSG